ncbi:FHA domain-containing protein [Clostridium sp. SHJSY1]|uniref:FHA domain-containing protein n=1 Tax=Clostridium sp. SHJSY1 TaxID=2942483 RepID=UPI002874B9FA|nr:FHA domain-containing protein [Clostridium sp. SHJSY1]MDS0527528.1 FHA domain-containing protein [Clostridium sp. SHJSY1]
MDFTKEISFETKISNDKTYLIGNFKNLELIDFQIEMINGYFCSKYLSIGKRQVNLEYQLYYEITSLISIDVYLKTNRISKKDFLDLIKNLCIGIVKAEERYLSSNNCVLDEKKIFIDKESLQVKYIYIPIEEKYNSNTDEKFKNIIKTIILEYANVEKSYSHEYIQKMLNFINEGEFSIKEFYNFFLSDIYIEVDDFRLNNIEKNDDLIQISNEQFKETNGCDNGKSQDNEVSVKDWYRRMYIIMGVAGAVTFILSILAFIFLNDFHISMKIGFVFLLIMIDCVIFGVLLNKKKRIKLDDEEKIEEIQGIDKSIMIQNKKINKDNEIDNNRVNDFNNYNNCEKNIQNYEKNNSISNKNDIPTHNYDNFKSIKNDVQSDNFKTNNNINFEEVNESKELEESMELIVSSEEETMLLLTNEAYLLSSDSGEVVKIHINKERFKLGRLSTKVDYTIASNVVGKIHAEIIMEEGSYYIVDLSSKNGTFINRRRLENNVPYQLNNDDEIMIANVKYIFKLY